jgi:hypothetical protein
MKQVIKYSLGLDGFCYAVFRDSIEAEAHEHLFVGCPVCCFGQYENSFMVNETLGM